MTAEEIDLMKKKIVEKRKEVHEKNEVEVGKRWSFEEAVSLRLVPTTPFTRFV